MTSHNQPAPDRIMFLDIRERNEDELRRLRDRKFVLEERKREQGGVLEPELEEELKEINDKLGLPSVPVSGSSGSGSGHGTAAATAAAGTTSGSGPPATTTGGGTGGTSGSGGTGGTSGSGGTSGGTGGASGTGGTSGGGTSGGGTTGGGTGGTGGTGGGTGGTGGTGGGTTGTPPKVVDPLFRALVLDLKADGRDVKDHDGGVFPGTGTPNKLTADEKALIAVYGLLEIDNHTDPGVEFKPDGTTVVVVDDVLRRRFAGFVSDAQGEFKADKDLFENVLPILAQEGDKRRGSGSTQFDAVRASEWASVVRTVRERGIKADDIHLVLEVQRALAGRGGIDDGAPPSTIEIDLPDLETFADVEILTDNVKGMQALYFSAMLDELRMFQVVDKLVELFQLGQLPFGRGNAGNLLYQYWKDSINRMSEVERRNLYGRAFGFPGGEPTFGNPNREFNDLWLRFVSAVSSFRRQLTLDELLTARIPGTVSEEQVRKAGRDLAANLSLHGYGVGYFAAAELQDQIRDSIKLLSDPEVLNAYGSRDMFQVIDQVATLELGGARNSVRYRTMANSGAIIIRWLADRADLLTSSATAPLLDLDEIRRGTRVRRRGVRPTVKPTDVDLVEACESWLAVTGTPEDRVEEYAQPIEAPMVTSRPIQIPGVARDLLESVGVGLPGTAMSTGNGAMTR
jgi:hypothetical protein